MDNKTALAINTLPGWLSLNEGAFLNKAARLVRDRHGAVVEIGSFQGKSTICLALSGQKVVAIDPHKGTLDGKSKTAPTLQAFKANIARFGVKERVELKRQTSLSAAKTWKGAIKLLFIDGLHDFKNAQVDYLHWSPSLSAGGIIAMHDAFCGWEGAEEVALKQIVSSAKYKEVGVVGSIVYGIKGRGGTLTRLNRFRCRSLIRFSLWLNRRPLPGPLKFFLIHRLAKALLLNRFTLSRN